MHETKEKVEKLCEMKDKLVCWTAAELAKGKCEVDTKEMGDVVDMIKDLAEAEEKCWKACFYKKVLEEMELEGEFPEGRMGYDHWRYSSGRFAPTGHGHRSGYHPMPMTPMMDESMDDWAMRAGYRMPTHSQMTHMGGRHGMGYDDGMMDDRHSRAYNDYQTARRHYTETKSHEDKDKMSKHAQEHVLESVETMRDIWRNADPELRRQMKSDLVGLVNEMQ